MKKIEKYDSVPTIIFLFITITAKQQLWIDIFIIKYSASIFGGYIALISSVFGGTKKGFYIFD